MKIWMLLRQNFRHVARTRMLIFILVLSFIVQYLGVKVFHSVTVQYQGVIATLGRKEVLFLAFFFQLFTGAFLAAVYGIWMVPYAHQGMRSNLTFTLPVSKSVFPLVYALTMLGLLAAQDAVMLLSFGLNFGFEIFSQPTFNWSGLWLSLGLQTLAFETFMFAFAFCSMLLGQIPTFFAGAISFFLLQLMGGILRFQLGEALALHYSTFNWMRWVYYRLPLAGELIFDLRHHLLKEEVDTGHVLSWTIWLAIFVLLFRLKLRYPARGGSVEGG